MIAGSAESAPALAGVAPAARPRDARYDARVRTVPLAVGLLLIVVAHPGRALADCEASAHGMRADGSDNSAAFTKTLTECAGQTIHIAHGTYLFNPSGYQRGFQVPANTRLAGDGARGAQATVLQIGDGGSFASFLWVRNVSKVAIYGIRFEGTAYDSGCSRHLDYGYAITIRSDAGQQQPVEYIDVSDDVFHDFNGGGWVALMAADGSPGIGLNGRIVIKNNEFDSDANLRGGCAANSPIGQSVVMVSMHGSDSSGQGLVANVEVDSNTFEAGYVKGAIAIWSSTRTISVTHNSIRDVGLHLPPYPGELGRYGITVYNSAHNAAGLHPDSVRITDNAITNPVSCGIYVASARNLQIVRNRISGQRDRNDATLPKGAIALNHAENVSALEGNELSDNYIGISSVGSALNKGTNRINAAAGGTSEKIR